MRIIWHSLFKPWNGLAAEKYATISGTFLRQELLGI